MINHIIMGDAIFAAASWVACIIALLVTLLPRRWSRLGRVIFFIVLSILLAYLFHHWVENFQQWYCCSHPWGEPMHLEIP